MSQEKVDRYKEQKKNRKKIMKQEKCKRYLGYTATVVVIALIIGWAKGADTAINRKWWDFMADIMETNPDNSPVSIDLKTVFHLD